MRGLLVGLVFFTATYGAVGSADIAIITRLAKAAYVLYAEGDTVYYNRCNDPVAEPQRTCQQNAGTRAELPYAKFRSFLVLTLALEEPLAMTERLPRLAAQTARLSEKITEVGLSAETLVSLTSDRDHLRAEHSALEKQISQFPPETMARLKLLSKIETGLTSPLPGIVSRPWVLDEVQKLTEQGVHLGKVVDTTARFVLLPFQQKNLEVTKFDETSDGRLLVPSRTARGEYLALQSYSGVGVVDYVAKERSHYKITYRESDGMPLAEHVGSDFTYSGTGRRWSVKSGQLQIRNIVEVAPESYVGVGSDVYKRGGIIFVNGPAATGKPTQVPIVFELPALSALTTSPNGYLFVGQLKDSIYYLESDAQGKELRRATFWKIPHYDEYDGEHPDAVRTSDNRIVVSADVAVEKRRCLAVASFRIDTMEKEWDRTYCGGKLSIQPGETIALRDGRVGLAYTTFTNSSGSKDRTYTSKASFVILDKSGEEQKRHEEDFVTTPKRIGNSFRGALELPELDEIVLVGSTWKEGKFLGRIRFLNGAGDFLFEDKIELGGRNTSLESVYRGAPGRELLLLGVVASKYDREDPFYNAAHFIYPEERTLTFDDALKH